MIASDLSDGLLGTAAVLTALGFLWMIIVHGGRLKDLSVDVHGVKVSVDTGDPNKPLGKVVAEDIKPAVDETNMAVNHKLPHELPLVKRVGVLEQNLGANLRLTGDLNEGVRVVVRRLDGLEKAARQQARFQRDLVDKLGLDITVPNPLQQEDQPT